MIVFNIINNVIINVFLSTRTRNPGVMMLKIQLCHYSNKWSFKIY